MRVDAYNKIAQIYQNNATKKVTKPSGTSSSDQLEISRTGKDYQVAKKAVANTEDIRMDKVNDIKKRLESGTYNITGEDLANKLLDNYFDKSI
jgi:negative regulator of flagellin synthesis FlgM